MGRKSSISRLPAEVKRRIQQLVRSDQHTLDELVALLQTEFPGAEQLPSRTALHRYRVSAEQVASRMREIETVSQIIVSELGENPNERAGQLLVQAVTTLATDCALRAHDSAEPMDVKSIGHLARTARNVMEARQRSLKERTDIEDAARARLLREQSAKLDKMQKRRGMTADVAEEIRREILGLPPREAADATA